MNDSPPPVPSNPPSPGSPPPPPPPPTPAAAQAPGPAPAPAAGQATCYRHPDRRAGVRCQRCERLICPACMKTASVGFHCPECARGGQQRVYTRTNWSDAARRPLATQVLIGINAAVFVAGLAASSSNAVAGRGGFAADGGLLGRFVADGEWWRVVTSGFLHAGLMHLLFNMLALFYLGGALEPVLGRARFVALYGTSLLTGSLGVLVLSPDALTVGASGAVFGLLGALLVIQRSQGIDPWSSGLGGILLINLLITFGIPGISIGGHLGGLAGGLLCAWLLVEAGPRLSRRRWAPTAAVVGVGVAAFAGCLVAASALA